MWCNENVSVNKTQAGNSCRRGGMKEAECQCQACWMRSGVNWVNSWNSCRLLRDEAGWRWKESIIIVCGWILIMKIGVDFFACFMSLSGPRHPHQWGGGHQEDVLQWQAVQRGKSLATFSSFTCNASYIGLTFTYPSFLLEMAGHHQRSQVPPEAAPPQHSGVPWLLPERTHSMGESHTLHAFRHYCLKEVALIFFLLLHLRFVTANCRQTVKTL